MNDTTGIATDGGVSGGAGGATTRSVLHRVVAFLSAAALLTVITIGMAAIVIPRLTGAVPLAVRSSSMEPDMPAGSLIVVRPVDTRHLAAGDVITYQVRSGEPDLITHRIVAVQSSSTGETSFVTKGDNNDSADPDPVVAEQVQGRLWYTVPLLGFVSSALHGGGSRWVVPAAAVLLLFYSLYALTSGTIATIRSRTSRRTQAPETVVGPTTM